LIEFINEEVALQMHYTLKLFFLRIEEERRRSRRAAEAATAEEKGLASQNYETWR
jgi:hypothetical protein